MEIKAIAEERRVERDRDRRLELADRIESLQARWNLQYHHLTMSPPPDAFSLP
jgi:hypothetical protein